MRGVLIDALRRLFRREKFLRGRPTGPVLGDEPASSDATAFDPELAEFLTADVNPPPVDPLWKEELRERLWELVEERREQPVRRDEASPLVEEGMVLRGRASIAR